MTTTVTASQFESICQIALAARNQDSSAVHTASISEDRKHLDVFGWSFGVAPIIRSANELLVNWIRTDDGSMGIVETVRYTCGDYSVTLKCMT